MKTESKTKSSEQPHWIVYKQEEIPNHIIEAKKRLGQIKQPHIIPPNQIQNANISKEQLNTSVSDLDKGSITKHVPDEASTSICTTNKNLAESKKKNPNHWIQWDSPPTPDYIQRIRQKLGDDRYKKLDLTKKYVEINRSKSDLDFIEKSSNVEHQVKNKLSRSKSSVSGFLTNIKESESQTVINGSNLSEKIRPQNSIAGTANDGNFYGQISNKNHTHPPNSPAKSPPNNPANNFNSEIENFYNILPVEEKPDFDNRLGRELYSRLSCDLQNYGSDKPPRSLSKMSFDQNQYSITENSTTNVPIQQWLQAAPEKGF